MKYQGAFCTGAVIGAALALLFAPSTGVVMRRNLGRRARDGRRRANDALDAGREWIDSAVDEGRARFQAVKHHAEEAIEEGRDAANRIVEQGRQAVDHVRGIVQ